LIVTLNVKLPPLSNRNSLSIAPFPLLAGAPPVDTTVVLPPVRVTTRVLFTVSVPVAHDPAGQAEVMLVELVYVIEAAALLEKPKISPPEIAAPLVEPPFTSVLFLMP